MGIGIGKNYQIICYSLLIPLISLTLFSGLDFSDDKNLLIEAEAANFATGGFTLGDCDFSVVDLPDNSFNVDRDVIDNVFGDLNPNVGQILIIDFYRVSLTHCYEIIGYQESHNRAYCPFDILDLDCSIRESNNLTFEHDRHCVKLIEAFNCTDIIIFMGTPIINEVTAHIDHWAMWIWNSLIFGGDPPDVPDKVQYKFEIESLSPFKIDLSILGDSANLKCCGGALESTPLNNGVNIITPTKTGTAIIEIIFADRSFQIDAANKQKISDLSPTEPFKAFHGLEIVDLADEQRDLDHFNDNKPSPVGVVAITEYTFHIEITDLDIDDDRILNSVDTDGLVPSNEFSDEHLGGTTTGEVTLPGDKSPFIFTNTIHTPSDIPGDHTETDGVKIVSSLVSPGEDASISACDGAGDVSSIGFGDELTVTCSSITVKVLAGSVDVQFNTGGKPATTTMVTTNSLTFADAALIITNNSLTDSAVIKIGSSTIIIPPGESVNITSFAFPGTSDAPYQDPNLGDVRHGEGHDNGFCMNQNCINVDGFFNHFPETIVPQGSTQTFSLLINCPRGVNTCNHASIEGVLPDSDFYEEQWGVTLDRQPRSDTWETTINNPYGEIGEVTTTVQEVGQSFLAVSFNIEFLIPGSIGTADGIRVAHENNRFLHVTVWDSNRGISNYIFNEGIYVDDIYAYPKVEASYDAPLEIEKLCLNENTNKRYTCAFDKVREWAIKNAEKALLEIKGITELDVFNEEFLSKFKELKQAIADDDSEKISELRMQLDELGIKIHNMKQ